MIIRPHLKGQRILVTGGAGFIGSHLIDALLILGVSEVVVVDNFFLGSLENLNHAMSSGIVTVYREDAEFASCLEYIFDRHNIGTVFNCATRALNYSFVNPALAFSSNVSVVLNLLEAQRRGSFRTLAHFSTSEVYGTAVHNKMDEHHQRSPTTTYAAGKLSADIAVETYFRMYNLDCYIVRPFNNFGPRQNSIGPLAGVIPETVGRILAGRSPQIFGDGTQTRDFIYVLDTVRAVLDLHNFLPSGESVNIAAENEISVIDLVRIICRELGYSGSLEYLIPRSSDVIRHNADTTKLHSLISFVPTQFSEALHETILWYKERYMPLPL